VRIREVVVSRIALFAVIGLVAWPALADEPAGRYSVLPSSDGFIRIDTATGAVSHCGKRDGAWYCDVLIEDRGLIERRLDALTSQVAALSGQIAALAARIEEPKPPAPAPVAETRDFPGTLMHKLFVLVRGLKAAEAGS
jgi:hypothetical protein